MELKRQKGGLLLVEICKRLFGGQSKESLEVDTLSRHLQVCIISITQGDTP